MRSIRTLIASSVVAALTVTALAIPSAAADPGKMTVVNGIPGKKIDVCIGSKEIRSGLKYGHVFKKQLTGTKKLRFRKASSGACKGALLGGKTVTFPSASSTTVVATSKDRKVLVFGNPTAVTDPDNGALALRHAADLSWNTVHFRRDLWKASPPQDPFEPSSEPADVDIYAFEKGDEYVGPTVVNPDYVVRVKVTRPDPSVVLAKSSIFEVEGQKRLEFIYIGSKAANAKLVRVNSALTLVPPG